MQESAKKGMGRKSGFQRAHKKAQMEIMGLAVIVILMIIGMLFVVKFIILVPPSTVREDVTMSTLAGATLHTLVSTTSANCNKLTFEELLRDCAEHYNTGGLIECPPDSCSYAKNEISKILASALTAYGVQGYSFNATAYPPGASEIGDNIISIGEGQCLYGGKAQTQPYSIATGSLGIDLMICR